MRARARGEPGELTADLAGFLPFEAFFDAGLLSSASSFFAFPFFGALERGFRGFESLESGAASLEDSPFLPFGSLSAVSAGSAEAPACRGVTILPKIRARYNYK